MINRSRLWLKDGSVICCEVESTDEFPFRHLRTTYLHNDTCVSLEGMKYLRDTIGLGKKPV